jgi:hypothetical protein
MSVRPIAEVRQRQSSDPMTSRELGMFTDTSMADQVIDACYRQAWVEMMHRDFVPTDWLTLDLRDAISVMGFDRWWADDKKSDSAMFYRVTHKLWNQVPSSLSNFNFTMEGAAFQI